MQTPSTLPLSRSTKYARVLAGVLLCLVTGLAQAAALPVKTDPVDAAADAACEQAFPAIAAYRALQQTAPH